MFSLQSIFQSAPEFSSISSICDNYEIDEYVLFGKGGTTAVANKVNSPKETGENGDQFITD